MTDNMGLFEHSISHHVRAWMWIHALTPTQRWAVCEHMQKKGHDWCQLVDCMTPADNWSDWKSDYAGKYGCLCDYPLPKDTGAPRPGWCYCPEDWKERLKER